MPKRSAGILLYRRRGEEVEILLVHPGGPFWAKKDLGAWSIPVATARDKVLAAQAELIDRLLSALAER